MTFNNNIEKEIFTINKIIQSCIVHGGDAGGAYCCDCKMVNNTVTEWLRLKNLEHDYKASKSDWCFIIPIDAEDDDKYIDKLWKKVNHDIEHPSNWESCF